MKLFEFIKQLKWSALEVRVTELYPDQAKDLKGFKRAFDQLQLIEPMDSVMTIQVKPIKEDWEEEEYAHVNGFKANPQNDNEKHMTYSLMITPWSEWLGMDISKETLIHYGELDTLVHILWEMTFVGYKEESVTEFENELTKPDLK